MSPDHEVTVFIHPTTLDTIRCLTEKGIVIVSNDLSLVGKHIETIKIDGYERHTIA